MNESLILKQMRILGISREEAISLINDDIKIDRMTKTSEINSDLSQEQVKASKTARKSDRKKTVYKFDTSKRKRTENPDKQNLIEILKTSLRRAGCTDLNVTNPEREFLFSFSGNKYKVVLSQPRK